MLFRSARTASSRSQRDMGAHPVRWQPTHAHTHALEITPDQAEAARNPGDTDTWARAVSRGKEKGREKRRRRAEFGPEGPRRREAREEIRPDDALPFFFFFLHDTDTRVPPVGETR